MRVALAPPARAVAAAALSGGTVGTTRSPKSRRIFAPPSLLLHLGRLAAALGLRAPEALREAISNKDI